MQDQMDEGNRDTREKSTIESQKNNEVKTVRLYPSFGREVASTLFKSFVFTLVFLLLVATVGAVYQGGDDISDGSCNIAVFPLEGVIAPYDSISFEDLIVTPHAVRSFIADAEADPYVAGILFEVNSPGGTPVASERIAELIALTALPTVGVIGDIGTSGAYLAISAADRLLASAMSDVGGIGVTMSYLENTEQNANEGLEFIQLSAGEFKDAGNPNKELTEEERAMFERDLDIIYNEFIQQVANYRELPVDEVTTIADGASKTGAEAVELGLVDAIGGRIEAQRYFADTLGLSVTEVQFCEYSHNLIESFI